MREKIMEAEARTGPSRVAMKWTTIDAPRREGGNQSLRLDGTVSACFAE